MNNASYVTLTRQDGLMREMQLIANNIANQATAGFKQQGITFSEYVQNAGRDDFLSMALAHVPNRDVGQGPLRPTGGRLDLAIQGEGYFALQTDHGVRLSRAGAFYLNAQGALVNYDNIPVLDDQEQPIVLPPVIQNVEVRPNGEIMGDGLSFGRVGRFVPQNAQKMTSENGVLFDPQGPLAPSIQATVQSGYLEESNVDPILQIARMIEIQRAFEIGEKLAEQENERKLDATQKLST